jgi:hypothetical protein
VAGVVHGPVERSFQALSRAILDDGIARSDVAFTIIFHYQSQFAGNAIYRGRRVHGRLGMRRKGDNAKRTSPGVGIDIGSAAAVSSPTLGEYDASRRRPA